MAKPKKGTSDIMAAAMEGLTSGMSGFSMCSLQEYEDKLWGIGLPHFSQQYLFSTTALPFSCPIVMFAKPGRCKSTLGYYFAALVAKSKAAGGNEGVSYLIDTEHKISPNLVRSFFEDDLDQTTQQHSRLQIMPVNSLNKGQAIAVALAANYKKKCPERNIPVCCIFDSISGAGTDESAAKMEKEGGIGRGVTDSALRNKHLFENWSNLVNDGKEDLPILFICISHETEQISTSGPHMPSAPKPKGSNVMQFKTPTMVHITSQVIGSKTNPGIRLKLDTAKNSFGCKRKINLDFRWKPTPDDPLNPLLGGRLDWARSTAELLADPPIPKKTLDEYIHVSLSDDGFVTCPELNLVKASCDELEIALHLNQKLYDQLLGLFAVQKIKAFGE